MQNKLLDLNSSPRIQTWIATFKTGKLECNASKPDKDFLNDHTIKKFGQSMLEWHDKVVFWF